jgi:hypothetical protein
MNELRSRIKDLETELVKLRLESRHIDFTQDYDRNQYDHKGYLSGSQAEPYIIQLLQKHENPVKTEYLIKTLVREIPNLSEADFEKTGSGNIRNYSTIRARIESLAGRKVIEKPERGMLQLADKSFSLLELERTALKTIEELKKLDIK